MAARPTPKEIAQDLLALEPIIEPDEWAAIENRAHELIQEARGLGVHPRDHAAAVLAELEASMSDRRIDLAVAAALVYIGRMR